MNLTGFAVDSPDNCEIVCRGQFANIDLRTAGHGTRWFEVLFDVDQNRSTGCPNLYQQGAEYRGVLEADGTQNPPRVSRTLYRWTSGGWAATPGILADVRLGPCSARFTVDRASLGSPSGGINVFAESYFQDGHNGTPVLADVIPSDFIDYPLQVHVPDAVTCPWVRNVNTTAIQNGSPSSPVEVEFSAPIDPPQYSDVTIVPSVAVTVSAGASPRFLLITPTSAFPPGSYQCTLAPTIHDCTGHALSASDSTSCGTPFTFHFCVPDTNMTTADGSGNAKEDFQVGEQVFLQASGESGLPGTVKAYLVDADVLDSPGRALIDQSDHGPTAITANIGVISLTSLGAARRPGDYAVVLDVNGDGIYETTDRTIDPCDGTIAVGSSCEDNLDAGVAAYWPLDESYPGAGALELEGGHDGSYVGSPIPQAGKVGGALGFDGSTNYVRVPNHPDLEVGTEDFSLSGWVYPTAISGINSIVDMRSATRGYHVALADGKLTGQLDDANGFANYQSSAVVPTGEWTHFVMSVARGSNTGLKIYLNGQLDSSHDPTAHAGDLTSGADLLIGGHSTAPTAGFVGALDEIVLWDSAMSAGDVSALYQAGRVGQACPDSAVATTMVPGGGASSGPAKVLRLTYPNPFRPGGRIQFTLAGRGRVRLGLFDAQGRRVAQLEDAVENQGAHSLTWDGRSLAGGQLPSGLYFVHVDSEHASSQRTLIFVR
jgi:hypothetical protein